MSLTLDSIAPTINELSYATDPTMQQVGTALLSDQLDQTKVTGSNMIKMMEQSVNPGLGSNLDISV